MKEIEIEEVLLDSKRPSLIRLKFNLELKTIADKNVPGIDEIPEDRSIELKNLREKPRGKSKNVYIYLERTIHDSEEYTE